MSNEQQSLEVIQPTQELAFLQFLERAASNPEIDVDKLERIMAMHKDMLALKAQGEFTVAMAKAQAEMPPVACDKVNQHTKSPYPSMEAVQDAIKDTYLENGFTCTFSEGDAPANGLIHVIGTVRHIGGHVEIYNRYAPADTAGPSGTKNKTEVQGSQSTVSYVSRRMLCAIFGVTIVGDDKDGNKVVEKVTEKQVADLRALADETKRAGETLVKVLKNLCYVYNIERIEDMPASVYQGAVNALNAKKGAND